MLPFFFILEYSEEILEYSYIFAFNHGKKTQNIGKNSTLEIRRPDFSLGLIITTYKALRKKNKLYETGFSSLKLRG